MGLLGLCGKLNVSGSKHKKNKIIHFRFCLDRKIRGQFFFFKKRVCTRWFYHIFNDVIGNSFFFSAQEEYLVEWRSLWSHMGE